MTTDEAKMTSRWEAEGTIIDVRDWKATHISVTAVRVHGVKLGHIHAKHRYNIGYEIRLRPIQPGDEFAVFFDRLAGPVTAEMLAGLFRPTWVTDEWSGWRRLDA